MLSQQKINGQGPRAEAVVEASLLSPCSKDLILYQLDSLLDEAGWPGDLHGPRGLHVRLQGYMSQVDAGMRQHVRKMQASLVEINQALPELRAKLRQISKKAAEQ